MFLYCENCQLVFVNDVLRLKNIRRRFTCYHLILPDALGARFHPGLFAGDYGGLVGKESDHPLKLQKIINNDMVTLTYFLYNETDNMWANRYQAVCVPED